jgi:hypothetical protein
MCTCSFAQLVTVTAATDATCPYAFACCCVRDERQRQDRLRSADELFNANLRASKAPPMVKPAAARGKKK